MDIDRVALIEQFVSESHEHLETIEEALIELEAQPDDEDLLELVFRMAHTFKGNAYCVGLQSLTGFAHTFETVLERLRGHHFALDDGLASLTLEAVDAFRHLVAEAAAGRDEPPGTRHAAHEALVSWLAQHDGSAPMEDAAQRSATEADEGDLPAARPALVTAQARTRTVRVEAEKLDRLIDLVGEIAVARGRLTAVLEQGGASAAEQLDAHQTSGQLLLDLHEQVMKLRMVPIGSTFRQLIRTVRDLSLNLGKSARLAIVGEEIELDTALVDRIRDPLAHMIRNAIDHGLEHPDIRMQQGKDVTGTVTVRAAREGDLVIIEVSDDGVGLSRERMLAAARARGIAAETLSDAELFPMVFDPGFSTATDLTAVSGRGVGMSVVRRNVESLRGKISVRSSPGRGTTFTMRLPMSLSIIDGFSVGAGGETFILPIDSVLECIELPMDEADNERDRGVVSLRGEPLPYLHLGRFFDLPTAAHARQTIVVIRDGRLRAGLAVDTLHGGGQAVVKPLLRWFEDVRGVAGSTLLGNGRVALLLDAADLLSHALEAETAPDESAAGPDRRIPAETRTPCSVGSRI